MTFKELKVGEFFKVKFDDDIYIRISTIDDNDPWYGTLANAVNLNDGTTEEFFHSTEVEKIEINLDKLK